MKYNIVITGIQNERAKKVLARQLAQDPAISLQKANTIVELPRFTLYNNLELEDTKGYISQLKLLGVSFQLVKAPAVNIPEQKAPEINIPPKQPAPLKKPADIAPSPPVSVTKTHVSIEEPKKKSQFCSVTIEPPKKNKLNVASIVTTSVFILFFVGMLSIMSNKSDIKITRKRVLPPSSSAAMTPISAKDKEPEKREPVSDEQANSAKSFVDSAKANASDINVAINFYKIAISFNEYNIDAWYGLLDIYKTNGMIDEMTATKEKMQSIFGNSLFSVNEIIERFGVLEDLQVSSDNYCKIEYKTKQKKNDKILSEIYTIQKALRVKCDYQDMSIFAKKAAGQGVIVHINQNTSTVTLSKFKKTSSVTNLD
ncbi:MAG: hypothetical protein Q4F84_03285 [Fibrobacter sp.]|nr:hypothetical protein [Fibrobacter sp.]